MATILLLRYSQQGWQVQQWQPGQPVPVWRQHVMEETCAQQCHKEGSPDRAHCTFTTGGNCHCIIILRGITALAVTTATTPAATPTATTTATRPTASRKNNWHGREVMAEAAAQYYCVCSGAI
jgi:hypothetical protein